MLDKGPAALSNAELLAILLRTGDGKQNAVEICRDLLKQADESLCLLSDWSIDKLQSISGIGPAKALTVGAAFEIARRWFSEKSSQGDQSVNQAKAAFKYLGPRLRSLSHEECWMLLLSRSNRVLSVEKLTSGTISATTFDSRAIVKRALEKHATAVILSHNHPSGNPRPGHADLECTGKIREALAAFDISLLDHIIVCDNCYYSFADDEIYPVEL